MIGKQFRILSSASFTYNREMSGKYLISGCDNIWQDSHGSKCKPCCLTYVLDFKKIFIYLFIFGCVGSLLLCRGFL